MSIVYSCGGEYCNDHEPVGTIFYDEKQDGRSKQPKKNFHTPEERRRFEEEYQRGEDE